LSLSAVPLETLLSADVDGSPVNLAGSQELVVMEGASVELSCSAGGQLVADGDNIAPFQAEMVNRNDTGFYQCLSEGNVDSIYLLVTCKSTTASELY
jgi:hypothetical protein